MLIYNENIVCKLKLEKRFEYSSTLDLRAAATKHSLFRSLRSLVPVCRRRPMSSLDRCEDRSRGLAGQRSLEQLDRSNRRSIVLLMHKTIRAPRMRGAEAMSCLPRSKELLILLRKEPLEPVVAASLSLSSILHRRRPRRGTLGEGFGAAGAAKFVWRLLGVGLIIVSSVLLSRATAAVGKTCGALGKQQVQSWALAAAAMKPECLWPRRPPLAPPPQPQAERWLLLESHSHSRRSGRYKIRPLR
jgi:hypothetical protein